VAFKLVQALLATLGWPAGKVRLMTESFLKLVAIATVADVVPLHRREPDSGEARPRGLGFGAQPRPACAFRSRRLRSGQAPTAGQVAFRIAPRLNAAGRMADANDVIELLLTEDPQRGAELAARLHSLNRDRQEAEGEIVRLVLDECLAAPVTDQQAALVFAGQDWHRGVVGIVASRLVDRFHRPVFVLDVDPEQGIAQGSGRSVPAFHLLEALESMSDLLLRFGGHRQAAGLTLASGRIPEFRERLNAYAAARLAPDDFRAEIEVDACLAFDENHG